MIEETVTVLEWFKESKPEKSDVQIPQWNTPQKPNWKNPWWNDENSITHKAAIKFTEDANISGQNYNSNESDEHAILVTKWTVTISDATITKTWDSEWDTTDFYWTNAATISTDWILELVNVTVNTDWKHANAVFAYWSWEVNIWDSTITTKNDNSWWIMVTWWWRLSASNVNITTEWNSSAAIRSDRWGWDIYVDWWEYTTNWAGSPAIYSTANIRVDNAKLTSTKSEWIIIEGKNSVIISGSTLTNTNTVLHWHSSTYKNIFLYQSMSWDADEWTASFKADWCKIITNKWDSIYVTNTKAEIELEDNEIINNDWDFLRIEWAARGKHGSNWWDVDLNLTNQDVQWDIIVDDISSLSMTLTEGSSFQWAINSENQSQNISVKLDSTSTWTLTSDSYISSLESNTEWYSNINLNWHILYIWENIVTSTEQLQQSESWLTTVELINKSNDLNFSTTNLILWWIGIIIVFIAILICIRTYTKK